MSFPVAFLRPRWTLLPLFLSGAALASLQDLPPPAIPDDGYPQRVVATLESAPEYHPPAFRLILRLESVAERVQAGRARVTYFPPNDELRRLFEDLELGSGDRIDLLIRLRRPQSYRNPGAFDYRRYLERQRIYWVGSVRNPRLIQVRSRGWHGTDHLRQWVTQRIGGHFEEDSTIQALVLGMVLGQRRRLPQADARRFQAGGLTHLLVVSGFNLALVGGLALWVGRRIPFGHRQRTGSFLFALVLIWIYAFLVEGNAPVIRAALMGTLMIGGALLDRQYSIGNALSAASMGILILDPLTLGDSSFQLTFLAVLGILLLAIPAIQWMLGWVRPAIRKLGAAEMDAHLPAELADWRVSRRLWCELHGYPTWFVTLPWRLGLILAEAGIITLSVQTFLLPLTLESYHRISPIALPLNVVGAIVAASVTPMGLLLLIMPQPVAVPVAWAISQTLRLFIWAVETALQWPAASFRIPSPSVWLWIAYGIAILAMVWVLRRRAPTAAVGVLAALSLILLFIALMDTSSQAPCYPVLTFLDVGQGDSTLIEMPNGDRIVVDGGGIVSGGHGTREDRGTFSIGEDVVSAYLFWRGFRRLDAIVLTHAHHDHMDGLFDLVRNFQVGEFWLGTLPELPRFQELLDEVNRRGIRIRRLATGDRVGSFRVLNPHRGQNPGGVVQNDDSLVLLLEAGEARALLTGDIERDLEEVDTPIHLLKVPHHGSRNTRLAASGRIPVISVGSNNRFGHPHPTKLPALRTDLLGAIRVVLKPPQPEVSFPGLANAPTDQATEICP